jgi:hypothetical protein
MSKAAVVSSKKGARSAAQRRSSLAKQFGIVFGGGTLIAAAIGAYFVVTNVDAAAPPPNRVSEAMPADHTGAIIVRDAAGPGCHLRTFNNATGTISDEGPAPCQDDNPSAGQAPLRASNSAVVGRFSQISGAFQHK